jgi:hypothetical protein
MLRAMMDDGQIPPEVIKRLWQVYSMCNSFPFYVSNLSDYEVLKRRFLDSNVEALLLSWEWLLLRDGRLSQTRLTH